MSPLGISTDLAMVRIDKTGVTYGCTKLILCSLTVSLITEKYSYNFYTLSHKKYYFINEDFSVCRPKEIMFCQFLPKRDQ